MDDIIIFSRTWEEHLEHLEEVFKQLKHADLKTKCSKCKFFKFEVHYLGYLVSVDGVHPSPEKLEAITKLLSPTNIDELCQFLSITVVYGKLYPFMPILLTVSLNCSGKEQSSNGLSNAIMLSISLKKNYTKYHLYNIQILTNLSNCLQMHPSIVILVPYLRDETRSQIN